MVNFIIRWCLNNRFIVILVTLLLLGVGYYALPFLPPVPFSSPADMVTNK